MDHRLHATVGILDLRLPRRLEVLLNGAVGHKDRNVDVKEVDHIVPWVVLAGPDLLEHDVEKVELLGLAVGTVLHGDDTLGHLPGGRVLVLEGVGRGRCTVVGERAVDEVAGFGRNLVRVDVVLGGPLEVLCV